MLSRNDQVEALVGQRDEGEAVSALRHCKAPDQPNTPGWKWARCPGCGWQGDRDHGAWQRIAACGLTHQAKPPSAATTAP
jgi:hypothetical protein